ncbi:MAG: hypothetical protein PW788_02805 [Micavibrio sp.]|nr:hypothetical protein [Micavibrio sp.]
MTPQRDVSHIFNKFAGKEVPMKEEEFDFKGHKYTQVKLADENDATVKEMRDAAKDAGLRLRLWLPGTMGTMDFRMDRVNARIEKEADGKYRVSPRFNLG